MVAVSRMAWSCRRSIAGVLLAGAVGLVAPVLVGLGDDAAAPGGRPAAPPDAKAADDDDGSDVARKAEIMNSPRWRRAIFELGEWLSSQVIYTPQQVNQIKADFNQRVARMSSYELEYLLDDLDAKFKIFDTPEARDVRAWVGQYLSVMSNAKRAEVLRDVPNVVTMSAGQLQQEILTLEQRRTGIRQQQAAFEKSRDLTVQLARESRETTAKASAAAMAQARASFSPYRNHGSGQTPFANAQTGATTRGIFGGWGFGFGFGRL
jgi:hypothetical protein